MPPGLLQRELDAADEAEIEALAATMVAQQGGVDSAFQSFRLRGSHERSSKPTLLQPASALLLLASDLLWLCSLWRVLPPAL